MVGGGREGEFKVDDLDISEHPWVREEFERTMAARKKHGPPLPPNVDVELQ
ncbi:hypothetical protein [Halovenus amylolytica]|uniref:hypothetical protein n=1 Tax=Halovenus amylolytica TaxID=2500550 RepID=UPI003D6A5777